MFRRSSDRRQPFRFGVTPAIVAVALWLQMGGRMNGQDAPHQFSSPCYSCHISSYAFGDQADNLFGNANSCQSCHVAGGLASNKAMNESDQAEPWPGLAGNGMGRGTSHRWDSRPGGRVCYIGNQGSISDLAVTSGGNYSGAYAKTYLISISVEGSVGVAQFNWSALPPFTGGGTNLLTGSSVAIENGLTLSFYNTRPRIAFRVGDAWQVLVRPGLGNPTNPGLSSRMAGGTVVCSTCHDQHSHAHKGPTWKMHGEARVDGALAARGDVTATIPDGIGPDAEGEET